MTTVQTNYIKATETVDTLRASQRDAEGDFERLKDSSTLDEAQGNPELVARLAEARSKALEIVKIRSEMLEAAQVRQREAAQAVLAEVAKRYAKEAETARQAVQAWELEQARLWRAIEHHCGAMPVPVNGEAIVYKGATIPPRLTELRLAAGQAEARLAAIEVAAAGGEPLEVCKVSWLPEELLPGGILCSARTEAALQAHAEAEAAAEVEAKRAAEARHAAAERARQARAEYQKVIDEARQQMELDALRTQAQERATANSLNTGRAEVWRGDSQGFIPDSWRV